MNGKEILSLHQCVSKISDLQTVGDLPVGVYPVLKDVRSVLESMLNGKPTRLSDNFTLQEFLASPTAVRHNITLYPDSRTYSNLCTLVEFVLQPARTKLGKPIYVSSGYRNDSLNRLVGGVSTSLHLEGRAADLVAPMGLHDTLFKILTDLPHTELIDYKTFIHVAL